MSRLTHYGHGIYCAACNSVYEDSDGCQHRLQRKHGIQKEGDSYIAQPNGSDLTHDWAKIDGMKQCATCGAVELTAERVER